MSRRVKIIPALVLPIPLSMIESVLLVLSGLENNSDEKFRLSIELALISEALPSNVVQRLQPQNK